MCCAHLSSQVYCSNLEARVYRRPGIESEHTGELGDPEKKVRLEGDSADQHLAPPAPCHLRGEKGVAVDSNRRTNGSHGTFDSR
jgi:hypothetical protein